MMRGFSRSKPTLNPCRHMEKWVNALADDSLTGWARWYTRFHVSGCKQCHATLEGLRQVRERLQALRDATDAAAPLTLSPERQSALRASFREIDRRHDR